MSSRFTSIRFVLALLTVFAIAGKPLIPPKVFNVFPSDNVEVNVYGPRTKEQDGAEYWLDSSHKSARCELPGRYIIPCGISIDLQSEVVEPCPEVAPPP